jgi:hypothetical protein
MRALQGRAKSCKWRNLAALRNRAICDDEPELCTCGQSSRSHLGHIAPDFFCQRSINGRGEPGPGKWVTIYANAGHACIKVAGIYLDTAAGLGNPPNPPPTGPRWSNVGTGRRAAWCDHCNRWAAGTGRLPIQPANASTSSVVAAWSPIRQPSIWPAYSNEIHVSSSTTCGVVN